jgi:hypothetical protein
MHQYLTRRRLVGLTAAAIVAVTSVSAGVAAADDDLPPRAGGYPGTAEPLNWPTTAPPTTEKKFMDPGSGVPSGPYGGGPRY